MDKNYGEILLKKIFTCYVFIFKRIYGRKSFRRNFHCHIEPSHTFSCELSVGVNTLSGKKCMWNYLEDFFEYLVLLLNTEKSNLQV